jgi:hypothetical protein
MPTRKPMQSAPFRTCPRCHLVLRIERSFVVTVADLEDQQFNVYQCSTCGSRYQALHPDGDLHAVQQLPSG